MDYSLSTKVNGTISLCANLHESRELMEDRSLYKFIWQKSGKSNLKIDYTPICLETNDILCLSPMPHVEFTSIDGEYHALLFNSNFYCIYGHDEEVSCNGSLFNGNATLKHFALDNVQVAILNDITREFIQECDNNDSFQEEMLRILLKRVIILCTRIVKKRYNLSNDKEGVYNLLRQFYVLVDSYYKDKKKVQDYASMLHRSPKTLSNVFLQNNLPSPLQVLHERTLVESKRLLLYSDKSAKEIAYYLGFNTPSEFSRFFRKMTGESISDFLRENKN